MRIDYGAQTDVGCVRELNEDNLRVLPELNLFILSDGIGGAAHGEVASEIAVTTIEQHCRNAAQDPSLPYEGDFRPDLSDKTNRLASALRLANHAIYQAASTDANMRGMGATIVAVWLEGERLSLAHVGDSRAYRLRQGTLEQLTRDHSLVAEQVRLGILTPEQAERSEYQTMLIRALGASETVEVDVDEHVMLVGDAYLLCSDGLSRMVPDDKIAEAILALKKPQKATEHLIDLAKAAGGLDNVTAILIRCQPQSRGLFGLFRRD
ncbi:MAG TPA: Stp1/IreP family PP2C-type Ser/Thr phosphatase [Candidatus Aquilonibacter sp.]|nr:Stp1/IreP family PP2C-type Ser/Thr phosphatase [Candidatus Aquilonibacter sp.]